MEKEQYIALIISDLNSQISESDAKQLADWREMDPHNEAFYKETKVFWEQSATYKSNIKVDSNKAWNKISSEIKIEPKKISIFSRYSKIAAAVLILLTTGFFLNTLLNDTSSFATAENETKEITLPDGSTILLNENSKIFYSRDFTNRKVELVGEAFFDVTKQVGKNFTVLSKNTETVVLGTSFNIDASDENEVKLALYSGKVKFSANNLSEELVPGERIVFNTNESSLKKEKKAIENEIAWKTKTLHFSNTSMSEVINELENHYGIKIITSQNDVSKYKFSGKFKDSPITEILEAISFSFESEYIKKENTYHLDTLIYGE